MYAVELTAPQHTFHRYIYWYYIHYMNESHINAQYGTNKFYKVPVKKLCVI